MSGLTVITALHDTDSTDDLQDWVDEFDVTHLVGGDYDDAIFDAFSEGAGRPQFAVIDRDFDLVHVGRDQDEAQQVVLDSL